MRAVVPESLVVEILSPQDETWEKLPWYTALGVREVLVIDPADVTVWFFRDGVAAEARSDVLGVAFTTTTEGLLLTWEDGSVTVTSG